MIAPSPMAFCMMDWFALPAFSMSFHCARGMLQLLTYEYSGGFSLTSDVCARAGTTQKAAAKAHSPATNFHGFTLTIYSSLSIWLRTRRKPPRQAAEVCSQQQGWSIA